jgi:glycosyltransferase involved in cell wall biosynthesis
VQGGVESVAATLVRGLQELNSFEIHVICPAPPERVGVEERNGIIIHWISTSRLPGVFRYWTLERRAIQRCLQKIKPDITHFQGVTGWSIGYKRPYVVTIHGIAEKDALYTKAPFPKLRYLLISAVERFARKRAPHVIAINPYVLRELHKQFGGRIWNIENPVSTDFFNVMRLPQKYCVLHIGRLIPIKNITGLIEAFAILLGSVKDAVLQLAGSADNANYFDECHEQLQHYGIDEKILFLGNIDRDALLKKLAIANCLVLLSHQENAPMAIAEAMAAGIPIVASSICGIPFMIEEGATGFLVHPNDPAAAATALAKILTDQNLADSMSARAREVAQERFYYRNVARKTAAVYFNALGLPYSGHD